MTNSPKPAQNKCGSAALQLAGGGADWAGRGLDHMARKVAHRVRLIPNEDVAPLPFLARASAPPRALIDLDSLLARPRPQCLAYESSVTLQAGGRPSEPTRAAGGESSLANDHLLPASQVISETSSCFFFGMKLPDWDTDCDRFHTASTSK